MKLRSKQAVGVCVALALGAVSAISLAEQRKNVEVSPFTDNINVNLGGFSASDTINISYKNNNDVDIKGPTSVAGDEQSFMFHINSNNSVENGNPTMVIKVPSKNLSCSFNFVDGPYTYFGYTEGNPPTCSDLSVSTITQDSQYLYHFDISYKPSS